MSGFRSKISPNEANSYRYNFKRKKKLFDSHTWFIRIWIGYKLRIYGYDTSNYAIFQNYPRNSSRSDWLTFVGHNDLKSITKQKYQLFSHTHTHTHTQFPSKSSMLDKFGTNFPDQLSCSIITSTHYTHHGCVLHCSYNNLLFHSLPWQQVVLRWHVVYKHTHTLTNPNVGWLSSSLIGHRSRHALVAVWHERC